MAYATYSDVQARMSHPMSTSEQTICTNLLDDAAIMIDNYNNDADTEKKKVVSIRMVMRSMSSSSDGIPIGATQGSQAGLGYSESWTVGTGAVGELYLGKEDKKLLGVSNKIGASSPLEALTCKEVLI